MRSSRVLVTLAFLGGLTAACAEAPQVGIMGGPSRPVSTGHVHFDTTIELPGDSEVLEPSQPFVSSESERLLAHVHTPFGVCSGVIVAPHLVATAHQCIPGGAGIASLSGDFHVEVASSSLTWATRPATKVVTAACGWQTLDLAVLVIPEAMDWVKKTPLGTVPGPGARVQAYGFGRCGADRQAIRDKAGSMLNADSQAFVIDVGLCKGDVGGFVTDAEGSLLGIISHQDDPDDSPRRTTTIFRADTTAARHLFAQAQVVADGTNPDQLKPVPCE